VALHHKLFDELVTKECDDAKKKEDEEEERYGINWKHMEEIGSIWYKGVSTGVGTSFSYWQKTVSSP